MLGDFIRLADYMTVSCCYLLTLSTAERLLELLSTPRKTGLWITTVEFGKSGMAFTPPQAHFMGSLQSLLEGMINNIHAVPRLLYMRPFKPYFPDVAKLVGPDVARLVREADAFQAAQERIEQVVLEDFERATTYAQQFEEYRVIHCFGEHWSFDAYAERQQTATFKESVVAFKQDMAQVWPQPCHQPCPATSRRPATSRPARRTASECVRLAFRSSTSGSRIWTA